MDGWCWGRVHKRREVEVNGVLAGICKQLRRTGSVQKLFQIRNSRVPTSRRAPTT